MLGAHEPFPVSIEREQGASTFFLTCDHAANRVPESLETLGLDASDLERHIAWDIGAAGLSRQLARRLDAPLVLQNYSRLVIDCNRPPESEQLVPAYSEQTAIPGNQGLDDAARQERHDAIFAPYHATIHELLDRRVEQQRPTAFVAIHSFTPVYLGNERPWHIGVLYDNDRRMAAPILEHLQSDDAISVGDNKPYRIDRNDYGVPVHGEGRGLPHVLIEIRQDLIASEQGQQAWASLLADLSNKALDTVR